MQERKLVFLISEGVLDWFVFFLNIIFVVRMLIYILCGKVTIITTFPIPDNNTQKTLLGQSFQTWSSLHTLWKRYPRTINGNFPRLLISPWHLGLALRLLANGGAYGNLENLAHFLFIRQLHCYTTLGWGACRILLLHPQAYRIELIHPRLCALWRPRL